jgi:hypothetical protein
MPLLFMKYPEIQQESTFDDWYHFFISEELLNERFCGKNNCLLIHFSAYIEGGGFGRMYNLNFSWVGSL